MAGTAKPRRAHFQAHTSTGACPSPAPRAVRCAPGSGPGAYAHAKVRTVPRQEEHSGQISSDRVPFSWCPSPGFASALSWPWDLGNVRGSVDPKSRRLREPVLDFFPHPPRLSLQKRPSRLNSVVRGSGHGHHTDLALSPAFTSSHLCDFWMTDVPPPALSLGIPICKTGPRMCAFRVDSCLVAALTNWMTLVTIVIVFCTILEARSSKSRHWKALREKFFLVSPSFWWPQVALSPWIITAICLRLHMALSLCLRGTLALAVGPTLTQYGISILP